MSEDVSKFTLSTHHASIYQPTKRIYRGISNTLSQADTIMTGLNTKVSFYGLDEGGFRNIHRPATQNVDIKTLALRAKAVGQRRITLPDQYQGSTSDPVITSLGYNYHAIAHGRFSPHGSMLFSAWQPSLMNTIQSSAAASKQELYALNEVSVYTLLECARVERLMIALYPSTRSYFVAATYDKIGSILATTHSPTTLTPEVKLFASYLYLALRPYIARPIRMRALDDLKKRSGVTVGIDDDVVMNAVHTYIDRSFKADSLERDRAWINEGTNKAWGALLNAFGSGYVTRTLLPDAVLWGLLSTCTPDSLNSNEDDSQDAGDQEELQKVAQQTQDGTGDGDNSEGQGDSSEEQGDSSEEQGDSSDSSPDGSSEASFEQMVQKQAENVQREAMQDEDTRREVEDVRAALGQAGTFSERIEGTRFTPVAEYVLMQKQMAREFGKIIEDTDPSFVTHQPAGRVSMKRAMHGIDDYDTAFDIWDEGKLAASSMEVVLLIDNSGSMDGIMKETCQSAWAITRGVESLGDSARVSMFLFNSTSFLAKRASERAPTQYTYHRATGGTDPTTALVDASKIFSDSNRAHKLCIILTDGSWSGAPADNADGTSGSYHEVSNAEVLIHQMQSKGITVALANMMDRGRYDLYINQGYNLDHGVNIVKVIDGPKDFVAFARSIVKETMIG